MSIQDVSNSDYPTETIGSASPQAEMGYGSWIITSLKEGVAWGLRQCRLIAELEPRQQKIVDQFGKTQGMDRDDLFPIVANCGNESIRWDKGKQYLALVEGAKFEEKNGNYDKAFILEYLAEELMADFYHFALSGKPQENRDYGLSKIIRESRGLYEFIGVVADFSGDCRRAKERHLQAVQQMIASCSILQKTDGSFETLKELAPDLLSARQALAEWQSALRFEALAEKTQMLPGRHVTQVLRAMILASRISLAVSHVNGHLDRFQRHLDQLESSIKTETGALSKLETMKESNLIREIREKTLQALQPLLEELQMFQGVTVTALPELDLDAMREEILSSSPEQLETFMDMGISLLPAFKKTEEVMKMVLPDPYDGWFD